MIAVVSHDKEGIGRNGDRTEVVARSSPAPDRVRIQMGAIGILHGLVINVNLFVADLDFITCYSDDPFYKILLGVFRKFEYHDIPSLGVLDRDKCDVQEWNLYTVYKLIYQDMIPDQKGRLHGTRGDFKCLYNKGADKKGKDDGDEDRLSIFPKDVLFRPYSTLG